ncbi:hypothetical protein T459_07231 [Capsicum annuum]|uniref:Protein TAR1-like n=1 Tax=Capsicum annuum TaxID=4072 RepID=A0A2G2ZT24_CAPAN|nr:hypothetical protein T459_07231 [Capsicum annuum]
MEWLDKATIGPTPKSDERFARQYYFGPPLEFPLASPHSGIVHHLSGLDRYAHTRTLLRRSRSVGGAPLGRIPPIIFLTPYGFTRPLTHTHVKLLGPFLKTGRMGSQHASIRIAQMLKHAGAPRCLPQLRRQRYLKPGLWPPPNPCCLGRNSPPDLDCIPKKLTRRQCLVVQQGPGIMGLSPSLALPSRGLGPGLPLKMLLQTTSRTMEPPDSKAGLFPVRLLLLRESLFNGLLATSRATNRLRRRDLNISLDHSIGRSDGRCVQRAGTLST